MSLAELRVIESRSAGGHMHSSPQCTLVRTHMLRAFTEGQTAKTKSAAPDIE